MDIKGWMIWGLCLILWTGCQTTGSYTPTDRVEPADTSTDPYALAVGDQIMITFAGIPKPPPIHQQRILEDGTIRPPLLSESVQAAGITIGKLQEVLYKKYVPSLYTSALSITVKGEDRFYSVDGEVRRPGLFPYLSSLTAMKAISQAGGVNDFAKETKIQIHRKSGKVEIFNYEKAQRRNVGDVPIYPGDIIFVPQRRY